MSKIFSLAAALTVALLPSGYPATATAQSNPNQAVFRIKSNHPNTVNIAYYSQTRRGWTWPDPGKHWIIRDYDWHTHTLNCTVGEKICFGAWLENRTGTYWGSGFKGNQACTSCCITCGSTLSRELNP